MAQEYAYIDAILKEFYAPAVVNQVYKKAPLWAQIQKRDKGMVGRRVVIPLQTAFTEAVGAKTANNYTLPTAGRNTYEDCYVYMKRIYGRIQVDGFSIEATKGKGSWIDVVGEETKGVANAFALDVDRQSMGRGIGVLGQYSAGAGGTSLTVTAAGGISGDTPVAKWFRAGMIIDSHDYSNSYTRLDDGLTISSISSAGVITLATACSGTLAANDIFTRTRVLASAATPADTTAGEMMGIDGIIDSADGLWNFQGIDRDAAGQEWWQAYESSTSQVISESVIQGLLDAIEKRTDGETVNLALTTYDLRNKLVEIIRADRMIDTLDLVAGWKAIKYVGGNVELPIMVHKNCPVGYFYAIALPHIYFYTLKNFIWDDKGGGILKPVANTDAYESWFKMYGNIATDCSNAHGKLTGLTTS